ncbi:hypothetical protein REPUB_Repub10bG0074100 [Reevesia pubescens]
MSLFPSHKDAAQFKTRSFSFYGELSKIYAKDRATGKDAQTAADILEEIEEEGIEGINQGIGDECETEHGFDDIDVSTTQSQPPTSVKKKRKTNEMGEPISAESIINAAMLLGDNIREVGKELSKSIGTEMIIQQRVQELDGALGEIEGLTEDEMDIALSKIPDHPSQILVFFSLLSSRRLGWVRRFLANH